MKWIFYNPNPYGNNTGDCVIRALTLAFGKNWDDVYSMLAEFGFKNKLMPSSNENWPALLRKSGFMRYIIPNECPDCYTVRDFCRDHPQGLCKKETWTGNDVALIGEMIDVVKDIETVEAMKEYEPEDWMRGYSRGYDEDYSMTRASYDRYREPNSYARGRDAMGRYTSRDDGKHEMIEHLRTMMDNARTPEERESYRSAIEHMSRN